jgi:hypothetical protein
MLGEFLSANVSTPFVLFMVKGMISRPSLVPRGLIRKQTGFGEFADDSEIAFWTGILGILLATCLSVACLNLPQSPPFS